MEALQTHQFVGLQEPNVPQNVSPPHVREHTITARTSQFYAPLCVSRIQVPRSMRSRRVDRDKSMGSHHLIKGDHQPITTQSGGHPSSF